MIRENKEGIEYLKFETFSPEIVNHAVFTRHGGVSSGYFESLNLGGSNGDIRENVIENRRRAFSTLNLKVESLFDVWQVHGDNIISSDRPRDLDEKQQKADAIITNKPGITLFMRFGDCVPILLVDDVKKVIALIHAGWPGTLFKIAAKTVKRMNALYDSNPEDITAGIGPSIGPDHYEIGQDVISKTKEAFPESYNQILSNGNSVKLDLWAANELVLKSVGVNRVEQSRVCTACNVNDWFSHRKEKGKTGRFGALIQLV